MGFIEVWDKDVGSDEHIGGGQFSITEIMGKPESIINVEISHKGKRAGSVQLKCKFSPDQQWVKKQVIQQQP